MPPRRSTKKTSKVSKSKKRKSTRRSDILPVICTLVLFLLGLTIGYYIGFQNGFDKGLRKKASVSKVSTKPKEATLPKITLPETKKPVKKLKKPCIAIVIDDFGYRKRDIDSFKRLPFPIAVSIIPFTPYDVYSATEAVKFGKTVMLHIPMEPNTVSEKIEKLEKKTVGMLYTSMSDTRIRRLLIKEIERIPQAVGANNHMGSKFTKDKKKMEIVLSLLDQYGLFFLDSKTAPRNGLRRLADKMGILILERDVFLDNSRNKEYIKYQLEQLARIASKRGYAIAIGHPHKSTLEALKEKVPELEKRGIKVVSIEELYEALGGEHESSLQKTSGAKRKAFSLLSGVSSRNNTQVSGRGYR